MHVIIRVGLSRQQPADGTMTALIEPCEVSCIGLSVKPRPRTLLSQPHDIFQLNLGGITVSHSYHRAAFCKQDGSSQQVMGTCTGTGGAQWRSGLPVALSASGMTDKAHLMTVADGCLHLSRKGLTLGMLNSSLRLPPPPPPPPPPVYIACCLLALGTSPLEGRSMQDIISFCDNLRSSRKRWGMLEEWPASYDLSIGANKKSQCTA